MAMGGATAGDGGGAGPPIPKVSGAQYPAILGEAGVPIGSRLYISIRHIYWIVVKFIVTSILLSYFSIIKRLTGKSDSSVYC